MTEVIKVTNVRVKGHEPLGFMVNMFYYTTPHAVKLQKSFLEDLKVFEKMYMPKSFRLSKCPKKRYSRKF